MLKCNCERNTSLHRLLKEAVPTAYRRAVEMPPRKSDFRDPGSRRNALSP